MLLHNLQIRHCIYKFVVEIKIQYKCVLTEYGSCRSESFPTRFFFECRFTYKRLWYKGETFHYVMCVVASLYRHCSGWIYHLNCDCFHVFVCLHLLWNSWQKVSVNTLHEYQWSFKSQNEKTPLSLDF